jgi:hypothetical protein
MPSYAMFLTCVCYRYILRGQNKVVVTPTLRLHRTHSSTEATNPTQQTQSNTAGGNTTQPNTLFPTYDEVVNLTGLL